MFRNKFRLGYLAPIALVAFLSLPQVFAQKPTVVSAVNRPLELSLTADTNVVTACADGGAPQVRLKANAVSPGGYPIQYKWTTSNGTITGEGYAQSVADAAVAQAVTADDITSSTARAIEAATTGQADTAIEAEAPKAAETAEPTDELSVFNNIGAL